MEHAIIIAYFIVRIWLQVPHVYVDVLHIAILSLVVPHFTARGLYWTYRWLLPLIPAPRGSAWRFVTPSKHFVFRPIRVSELPEAAAFAHEHLGHLSPLSLTDRESMYYRLVDINKNALWVMTQPPPAIPKVLGLTIVVPVLRNMVALYRVGQLDYRAFDATTIPDHRTGAFDYLYVGTIVTDDSIRHHKDQPGYRCALEHMASFLGSTGARCSYVTSLSNARLAPSLKAAGFLLTGRNWLGWPVFEYDRGVAKSGAPGSRDIVRILEWIQRRQAGET